MGFARVGEFCLCHHSLPTPVASKHRDRPIFLDRVTDELFIGDALEALSMLGEAAQVVVGHRIPSHVHLFPVPREVIGFFPSYREYSYFVVGDEICIVNPATYEVVDVIDQGYWRGPGRTVAGLHLSPAQFALVRDSIPRDFPEANVRLRLALGAEIPDDVELYDFPPIVVDRVPELREFRFLVTDEQIVIIDPHDRSIALMVDRA
jgi:uncharacterized protein DUF1236